MMNESNMLTKKKFRMIGHCYKKLSTAREKPLKQQKFLAAGSPFCTELHAQM